MSNRFATKLNLSKKMPVREIVNKQKAPKDTILNNIMKEIGEENGIIVDVVTEKNPKKAILKKKKHSWLRLFFTFMFIVIILCVLFVIYIISIATNEEISEQTSNTASHTQIVVPIKVSKTVEKSNKNINLPKKEQNPIKKSPAKTIPLSKEAEEALIRKKAKKALMEQMRN